MNARHPDRLEAAWKLAYLWMQCGQPARAVYLLEGLDAWRPQEATTLRLLAWARLRGGRVPEALDTLEQLTLIGDHHPGLDLLRAQALAALGRRDAAQALMAQVMASRQRPTRRGQTDRLSARSRPVQTASVSGR